MSTTVAKGARAWHADSRIAPSIRSRWASLPARPRPPALSTRAAALAHLDAAANDALNALFGSEIVFPLTQSPEQEEEDPDLAGISDSDEEEV